MLMSKECGDNAIVESHCQCCCPIYCQWHSTESCLCFPPSLESAQWRFPESSVFPSLLNVFPSLIIVSCHWRVLMTFIQLSSMTLSQLLSVALSQLLALSQPLPMTLSQLLSIALSQLFSMILSCNLVIKFIASLKASYLLYKIKKSKKYWCGSETSSNLLAVGANRITVHLIGLEMRAEWSKLPL